MTLHLSIENVPSLSSGDPVEITLAEHGLVIGRAAHADWTLPDPSNHVSSIHCEIDYRDGRYVLTDRSTNGTFVNGAAERLPGPTALRHGDLVQIGQYRIRVEEVAGAPGGTGMAGATGVDGGAGAFGGGIDWRGIGADAAAKPLDAARFGREQARSVFQSAHDPLMRAFAPPLSAPQADPFGVPPAPASPSAPRTPADDPFGIGPAPTRPDPFGVPASPAGYDPFGTPASPAAPPPAAASAASHPFGLAAGPSGSAHDPFGTDPFGAAPFGTSPLGTSPPDAGFFGLAAASAPSHQSFPPPSAVPEDPFGARATPASAGSADPWATLTGVAAVSFTDVATSSSPGAPAAELRAPSQASLPLAGTPASDPPGDRGVHAAAQTAPTTAAVATDGIFDRLLAASGLDRRDIGGRTPERVVDTIGQLLRQTADGLFNLLEARTRVRHQFGVGAQVTTFQSAGNNPLKWTRSPEQALKQMVGDPGHGFLDGTQAVRGAFEDLQAHEMAMMAAMQAAIQATIRRFAPETIRTRIGAKGWLKSVLPSSREATLWRAYETEFSAFAGESEAAYLDLFAKHFKKAYEEIVSSKG